MLLHPGNVKRAGAGAVALAVVDCGSSKIVENWIVIY